MVVVWSVHCELGGVDDISVVDGDEPETRQTDAALLPCIQIRGISSLVHHLCFVSFPQHATGPALDGLLLCATCVKVLLQKILTFPRLC